MYKVVDTKLIFASFIELIFKIQKCHKKVFKSFDAFLCLQMNVCIKIMDFTECIFINKSIYLPSFKNYNFYFILISKS